MSQDQKDLEFRQLADSFINVANDHSEKLDAPIVGSSMMYASARFSAFVVASNSKDRDQYETEIDNAVKFFSDEFKRMLIDNMNDYKSVFKAQTESKYEHLVKDKKD